MKGQKKNKEFFGPPLILYYFRSMIKLKNIRWNVWQIMIKTCFDQVKFEFVNLSLLISGLLLG